MENYDLTFEQHLARARELLEKTPTPGDIIVMVETRRIEAQWHIAMADLKRAEARK